MKKNIFYLLFFCCFVMCFSQNAELQNMINDYFENSLSENLPFIKTFPFNITERECEKLTPEQYKIEYFGGASIGRCPYYSLLENYIEDFSFFQGSTAYILSDVQYCFDNDGIHKVIYGIKTKTNFYWLDNVLTSTFELVSKDGKTFTSDLFDFAIDITLDAEEREDGYFYSTITVYNLKNLYIF